MLGQLVRWGSQRSRTFVQSIAVDVSRETQERLGQVFGILATEADERIGDAVVAHIEDALVRGINEGLLMPDASPDRIFEIAVARVNAALPKLFDDRNLPVDPAATHGVLVLQRGADVVMATWGEPQVLLFHVSDRRPSGRVYDLLMEGRDEQPRPADPGRYFANIISGTVGDLDRLLLATRDLTQWLSQEELKRLVLTGAPDAASTALQNALLAAAPKLAVALLLVDAERPDAAPANHTDTDENRATQHSMDSLHGAAERTSNIMSPPVIANLLRTAGSVAVDGLRKTKDALVAGAGTLRERMEQSAREEAEAEATRAATSPASAPTSAAMPSGPAIANPADADATAKPRLNVPAALRRMATDGASNIIHTFNGLGKKRRLLLLASLALVLVLNHSVAVSDWNRRSAAATAVQQRLLMSIEQKIDSAESSIIYRDESRARALLEEASVLIADLPDRPEAAAAEKARLAALVDAKFDALRHAVALPAADIVASVANANGPADLSHLVLRQQVAWTVAADGSVYRTDLRDGATREVGAATAGSALTVPAANGLLVGGTDGLRRFAYANDTSAALTLATGDTTPSIADADMYGARLYILDAAHNRILRHDAATAGYTAPQVYNRDGTDISSGVSLAIDGAVYVALADGSVVRFMSGNRENFAVQRTDPAVTSPVKLRTAEGSDRLYLLDSASPGRVLAFSKRTGGLLAQYVSGELGGATDFAVDEAAQTLYAVRDNAILKFAIPETR